MTALEDLPVSCKLVAKTLEAADSPLTQKQIAAEAEASRRTVQYACKRLEASGHIESQPNHDDLRQPKYALVSEQSAQALCRSD